MLDAIAAARRSRAPENDYDLTKARDEGTLGEAPLPESVDLREPWHAVPDQGHTASCVGWSLADSVLRWHLVKAGQPRARRPPLGPPHLDVGEGDRQPRGLPVDVPGGGRHEPEGRARGGPQVRRRRWSPSCLGRAGWPRARREAFVESARSRRIAAYFNLGDDDAAERRFAGWRRWLAEHGPVAVLIQMDGNIPHAAPRRVRRRLDHGDHSARAVRVRTRPLPAALELG